MNEQPTLKTECLILRPLIPEDAPEIQRISAHPAIAATTSEGEIPGPGMAEQWIKIRNLRFERGDAVDFAIVLQRNHLVAGVIGLSYLFKKDRSMQLGYWMGKDYWNHGYCTEAARALIEYGFNFLGLHRIFSRHFTGNIASGRVLQKIGMRHEGTLREAFNKSGKFENLECYGILKSEFHTMSE